METKNFGEIFGLLVVGGSQGGELRTEYSERSGLRTQKQILVS